MEIFFIGNISLFSIGYARQGRFVYAIETVRSGQLVRRIVAGASRADAQMPQEC